MDFFTQSSSLITRKVAVCSDQPLASKIGLDILEMGGNAADAAVAVFAAVSIIEPFMSGIGGDIQCLFYSKSDNSVQQLNGSGKTGKNTKMENVRQAGIDDTAKSERSQWGLFVSIPGAVAAMFNIVKNFGSGKLSMIEILQPAIKLAEEGVPIPRKTTDVWNLFFKGFAGIRNVDDFHINGKPPKPGEILTAPKLAQCYKEIATLGAEAFYSGPMTERIIAAIVRGNGNLSLDDFKEFYVQSTALTTSDAFCIDFHGYKIWEMTPSTIGIVALVALRVLERYDLKVIGHNTAEYIYIISEVIKLSYLECWDYLCDPDYCIGRVEDLLTDETADKLMKQVDMNRANRSKIVLTGGNTTYIAVVDEEGNGCSFMASISQYFGSGLIPDDCGFFLNDRLKFLSLNENSPNAYGPSKSPFYTLMPSLVTDSKTDDLLAVLGMVGRWVQPIGQVQVLLNMIIFGMDPQAALNQLRFSVGNYSALANYRETCSVIYLENGIDPRVVPYLESKGYTCKITTGIERDMFGKGHVIARSKLFDKNYAPGTQKTWWSGTEPRWDCFPAGF